METARSPFYVWRFPFPTLAVFASASVFHRYHDATDRYGRHGSPIFRIRFGSGRFRSPYSR